MEPIICDNNTKTIIKKIQEYLAGGCIIKSIYLIDHEGSQTILLIDDKEIDKKQAEVWWNGYSAGMQAALQ